MSCLLLIALCGQFIDVHADLYRFDQGYIEYWYQVPAFDVLSAIRGDTVLKIYNYRFFVCSDIGDTTIREGRKGAGAGDERVGDCLVDFSPFICIRAIFITSLPSSPAASKRSAKALFRSRPIR